jgi:hypothetical protein
MVQRVNCIFASRCGTACYHSGIPKPLIGDAKCLITSPPRDVRLQGVCSLKVEFKKR